MCLDLAAILQCNTDLTDGFVNAATLGHVLIDSRAKRSDVRELVEQGRWEPVADGWMIHNFDKHNPKAASVKERREAHKAEMADWRRQQRQEGAA
jgi:hypothetical protein